MSRETNDRLHDLVHAAMRRATIQELEELGEALDMLAEDVKMTWTERIRETED